VYTLRGSNTEQPEQNWKHSQAFCLQRETRSRVQCNNSIKRFPYYCEHTSSGDVASYVATDEGFTYA